MSLTLSPLGYGKFVIFAALSDQISNSYMHALNILCDCHSFQLFVQNIPGQHCIIILQGGFKGGLITSLDLVCTVQVTDYLLASYNNYI